jgi:hypothetical protein
MEENTMGWFSSKEDDNNEAYAKGVDDGQNATVIDHFVHDVGQAIQSNFGEPSSTEDCYNKGFDAGWKGK